MAKYKVGYTIGVFDLLHVGHINIINKAKSMCDFLIVGLLGDEYIKSHKEHDPLMNEEQREIIVSNLKSVDCVVIVNEVDRIKDYHKFKFDASFTGDDWFEDKKRRAIDEELFSKYGVDSLYFPYTKGISSSKIKKQLEERV